MCLTNDGGNRANRLGGDPNWYTSARNMMFSSATCDDLSASSRSDDTYSMDRPPPLVSRVMRPRIAGKFASLLVGSDPNEVQALRPRI
jgi:hypothetical protein